MRLRDGLDDVLLDVPTIDVDSSLLVVDHASLRRTHLFVDTIAVVPASGRNNQRAGDAPAADVVLACVWT